MKIPINVPNLFEERSRLTSRSIKRSGFQMRGVIFTSSESPSQEDFGPDPNHLIGKFIEKTAATGEPDRFFEILGGYFYDKDTNGNNLTTKVFGIALDRSQGFEMSENGDTIIVNDWKNTSTSKPKQGLYEDNDRKGETNKGWTFIVSPKSPETKYPRSHQPLAIVSECGTILSLTHTSTLNATTKDVSVQVNIDGTMPTSFEWDWGDGSPLEVTDVPTASHSYERPLGDEKTFNLKVKASGPGGCSSQDDTDIPVDGVCPEINIIDINLRNIDATSTEVFAKLEVKIGPANSYEWDWGDGSPKDTTTEPSAKHNYERSSQEESRIISVTAIGPGRCSDGDTHTVLIPPTPCPENVTLDLELDLGSTTAEVLFTVTSTNATPDSFEWDFGDGSPKQTTTVPTVKHTYERPSGNADEFIAKVNTAGPGSHCSATADIPVRIPGTCPVISKIDFTKKDPVGATQEVLFKAIVNGGTPSSYVWDFGDGSTQTTDTPEVSHTFDVGPGTDKIRTVTLNSSGPDNCASNATVDIDFNPIVCPLISEFGYTLKPISGNKQPVEFSLNFSGDTPNEIKWDFGDGSTEVTSELSVIHEYEIPRGDADIFNVKAILDGPADCATQKELQLKIGGVCPLLTKLSYVLTDKDVYSETQNVDFEILMDKENGSPDSFEWDFGDGSPKETTKTPKVSHTFARPFGDGKTYTVNVVTSGPESCSAHIKTDVPVPGICPTLGELTLTKDTPTPSHVSVSASVEVKTGTPDYYMWDWGDGSPLERTDTPTATHEYARISIDDNYTVVVVAHGPGRCSPSASRPLDIPGKPGCPSLTRINQVEKSQDKNSVTVEFSLSITGGTPNSFMWDFGDGSPEETTTTPSATHTFAKDPKRTLVYDIHVHTKGPDDCSSDGQTEVVVEPGVAECPTITDLTLICPPSQGTEFKVEGKVSYTGPKPEKFIWTWGDGAVDTTTVPQASHLYKRPQGQDRTCIVKVETEGPGNCKGKAESSFTLPKLDEKEPSLFCRIMPFLGAFFMALMLGMLIVCVAGEMLGHADDTTPVIIFTAVAFILLAIVFIMWQIQGAKLGCPPTRCSWLAVGWVAMLTGLIVTFFFLDCFASWLIMAIVFFLLFGIAAYFWFTTCVVKTKARIFFIYLLMSILAAAIVILFGTSVLHCC